MTGGGKIVGLGPRRDEASLSSTAFSLRKTLHWGSTCSVPLPHVQCKGAAFLGPHLSPTPGAWWSSLPFSPHPPLVLPLPASPECPQPKVLQAAKQSTLRFSAATS